MAEVKPKKPAPARAPRRAQSVRQKSAHGPHLTAKIDEQPEAPKLASHRKYFVGVGRRKEAVVRVQVIPAPSKPEYSVNGKPLAQYFSFPGHAAIALSPLEVTGIASRFSLRAHASGGGLHGQAEALRMGIARALVLSDPGLRMSLRALGYLTRDSRAKERKKPGLKRARRAPQFSKR